MKKALSWFPVLVLAPALAIVLACDSANPVAPSGTILTISASPNQIDLSGNSTITVIGRQPNGNPLNRGTEIRFSTSLGTIDPVIATVDDNGRAQTTLRGDGRAGTATVQATTGGGTISGGGGDMGSGGTSSGTTASIDVKIGRPATSVSLQATPASVPESGATVQLLALVRDDSGEPLGGIAVNFQAQIGSLQSGGSFIRTDASGQASDVLDLGEGDLTSISGDSFTVSVEAAGGGGDGVVQSDDLAISILRRPEASFTANTDRLTVVLEDTSSGNPTSWAWTFGDGSDGVETQNTTHTYDMPGRYKVTLVVKNPAGTSESSQFVTVSNQG